MSTDSTASVGAVWIGFKAFKLLFILFVCQLSERLLLLFCCLFILSLKFHYIFLPPSLNFEICYKDILRNSVFISSTQWAPVLFGSWHSSKNLQKYLQKKVSHTDLQQDVNDDRIQIFGDICLKGNIFCLNFWTMLCNTVKLTESFGSWFFDFPIR